MDESKNFDLKEMIKVLKENDISLEDLVKAFVSYETDTTANFSSEIIKREKEAWKKVLGVDVEISPLPDSVTPEVIEKLKDLGMKLRFIPALDLGTLADIKRDGVDKYLENLQLRYPNWHRYEFLTYSQLEDYATEQNLEEWYWNSVKDEKISFPQLSGKWMAVETMSKPKHGDNYSPSKITDELGLKDRLNATWNNIINAINSVERLILSNAGLHSGKLRILEAIEWNSLANREGWRKTDTYEWTNTEYSDDVDSCRIIVGYFAPNLNPHVGWSNYVKLENCLGFRLAIFFE